MQEHTKFMAAPHFPYDENTMLLEHDDQTNSDDGGLSKIQNFVTNDPFVKNKLVSEYSIREFKLNGATTEFDRLAKKYVQRS